MDNSELRRQARERLSGNWKTPVLVTLVYMCIAMIPSIPQLLADPYSASYSTLSLFGSIVSLIITGPLVYGLTDFYLKFVRNEENQINDLFNGFKEFGRSLVLYLLIGLFVLLWSLLFIIPGIIASYRYALAFYILRDNPQMSASEALNESKRLMDGYKMDLFLLGLSFIGWALLCILTLGIGLLWLGPYMNTAYTNFYEERIKLDKGNSTAE